MWLDFKQQEEGSHLNLQEKKCQKLKHHLIKRSDFDCDYQLNVTVFPDLNAEVHLKIYTIPLMRFVKFCFNASVKRVDT